MSKAEDSKEDKVTGKRTRVEKDEDTNGKDVDLPPAKKQRLETSSKDKDGAADTSEKKENDKEKEKTPELEEEDIDIEEETPKKKKMKSDGLLPALDRKPSSGCVAMRTRKKQAGLGRVPSFALEYNGLKAEKAAKDEKDEKDVDVSTSPSESKKKTTTAKEDKKDEGTDDAAVTTDASKSKTDKTDETDKTESKATDESKKEDSKDSDESEEQESRQALLGELKEQLVPCSRKLIESKRIDHVLWFDEDDEGNHCLWVAKLANYEFDESHEASNLLVTWPGYINDKLEYWIPAICNGGWHAFQPTRTVLDDKYKHLLYQPNFEKCENILKNATEYPDLVSDSEGEEDDETDKKSKGKSASLESDNENEEEDSDVEWEPKGKGASKAKGKGAKGGKKAAPKAKKPKLKRAKTKKGKKVTKKKKNAAKKASTKKKTIKEKKPKTKSKSKKTATKKKGKSSATTTAAASATTASATPATATTATTATTASSTIAVTTTGTTRVTETRGAGGISLFNGMDSTSMTCVPVSGKPLVGKPADDANKDLIEILFSFDTTGSMYSCLDSVRENLQKILQRLFKDIPNIRVAVLAHGDYCDENMYYVMQWIDFTDDLAALCAFVTSAGPTGGGDAPECYELVLHNACRAFRWNPKCENRSLVLIGDANPHEKGGAQNPHNIDWVEKTKDCVACGIKIYGIHCLGHMNSQPFYKKISEMSKGVYLSLDKLQSFAGMMVAICHRERDLTDDARREQRKKMIESHPNYKKEKHDYREACESLESMTVEQLKNKLRTNTQKVSGTKRELIERIADRKLYGNMPKCTECGSGTLRVIYENNKKYGHSGAGRYFCPGYVDDEGVFQQCLWTGDESKIKRTEWKD